MFETVLIANRGEIARRVIQDAGPAGDRGDSPSTPRLTATPRMYVRPGRRSAINSYLEIDQIIEACVRTGAPGASPGYGFLSESPALARA